MGMENIQAKNMNNEERIENALEVVCLFSARTLDNSQWVESSDADIVIKYKISIK